MDGKSVFEKYYNKVLWESIIKSLLCAVIVGFVAAFIIAFATWFTEFNGCWLALGTGLGLTAASTPLFFFFLFRPTTKKIAERLDGLGLDERLITMLELENDESYIAMRQREDARASVHSLDSSVFKFVLSLPVIIVAGVSVILGISMTTVTGLSSAGVIPGGKDFVDSIVPPPPPVQIEVSYLVEGDRGGYIEGDAEQIIYSGEGTELVVAVAEDGWAFEKWSDGLKNPARQDNKLTENKEFYAKFVPLQDGDGDGGDGDDEGEGDAPGDEPSQDPGPNENPDPSDTAGGNPILDDTVLDGNTNYRDVYLGENGYYDEAIKNLIENSDLTPEERAIIEAYLNIIK